MNVATPIRIAVATILFCVSGAIASAATLFTPIPKDAPFYLPACNIVKEYSSTGIIGFDATDLDSRLSLQRLGFKVRLFDDIHVLVGERAFELTALDVQPGDTKRFSREFGIDYPDSVREVQCSITSATFVGGTVWRPGTKWKGKLLERKTNEARETGQGSSTASQSSGEQAAISLEKVGAPWTDLTRAGAFVHARVKLTTSAVASLRASDLQLLIGLPSGLTMKLPGRDYAAPMGDANPLTGALPSPQVKPQEDLGALGLITIRPGTPVTLIATFAVPGAVASGGHVELRDILVVGGTRK